MVHRRSFQRRRDARLRRLIYSVEQTSVTGAFQMAETLADRVGFILAMERYYA